MVDPGRGGELRDDRPEDSVGIASRHGEETSGLEVDQQVFAVDGAVSLARTAAFFANNGAPLTSRTVSFISQSTVTQREVESNPNIGNFNSTST